jgi:hypothetical protein
MHVADAARSYYSKPQHTALLRMDPRGVLNGTARAAIRHLSNLEFLDVAGDTHDDRLLSNSRGGRGETKVVGDEARASDQRQFLQRDVGT